MMCSSQLKIPQHFPDILKEYSKDAIRTQPYDILEWSAAYFRAKASGEIPPVKERLEFPPVVTSAGLTPEYLKMLLKKFGFSDTMTITKDAVTEQWKNLCLKEDKLLEILDWNHSDLVDWPKFIAVAAGYVGKSLTETMVLLIRLLGSSSDTEVARIPTHLFCDLYSFLASLDAGTGFPQKKEFCENDTAAASNSMKRDVPGIGPKVPAEQINDVIQYVMQKGDGQGNMIMTENLLDLLCPPLDAHM